MKRHSIGLNQSAEEILRSNVAAPKSQQWLCLFGLFVLASPFRGVEPFHGLATVGEDI